VRAANVGHSGNDPSPDQVVAHHLFWTAHLIATHSNGISALQLANQIGVKEDTAWLLLHKFRAAMSDRERQPLYGVVEVDQTESRSHGRPFGGLPDGKITIIGAVEIVDRIR